MLLIDMKSVRCVSLCAAVFLVLISHLLAQSKEIRIVRSVRSETRRDKLFERALSELVVLPGEVADIRYYFNRIDLNRDGIPEVIAFVFGEHQCGSGGCHAYLFRKIGSRYKLVTSFGPTRNPIIVSTTRTNGWDDLIFFNSGGGIIPGYYSIARYDGRNYPSNPSVKDKCPPIHQPYRGTAYLVGDYHQDAGLRLLAK
jgi:hypothetical protein